MVKTCMITGHRQIPDKNIAYIKKLIYDEITKAIDSGYTHFISGYANGIDLLFAEIIAEMKNSRCITLEAAIPYRKRLNTKDNNFQRLLLHCDIVGVHSEEYVPSVFMKRNRYMVKQSDLVLAVYDGRLTGGTISTIRYAYALGRNVKVIMM